MTESRFSNVLNWLWSSLPVLRFRDTGVEAPVEEPVDVLALVSLWLGLLPAPTLFLIPFLAMMLSGIVLWL
jgi:hypothetical protein